MNATLSRMGIGTGLATGMLLAAVMLATPAPAYEAAQQHETAIESMVPTTGKQLVIAPKDYDRSDTTDEALVKEGDIQTAWYYCWLWNGLFYEVGICY